MTNTLRLLAPLSVLFAFSAVSAQGLEPGAEAPSLKIEKWVLGKSLTKFEKGITYVVEFWGEDPNVDFYRSRDYAALRKKYRDKIDIVAVIAGSEDYGFEDVAGYYAEHAKDMKARVAFDADRSAHEAWVGKTDGEPPFTFLVDSEGRIAWTGGFSLMEIMLPKVLAGGHDPKALAEEGKAIQAKLVKVLLIAAFKPEGAVEELDKIVKEAPALEALFVVQTYHALLEDDEPKYAYPLESRVCDIFIANEDPDSLNGLAWTIVDPEIEREERDLATAERAAKKAVALTGEKAPDILDTLARVYFWKKDYERAVAVQEKAIALLEDGERKDGFVRTLAEYRAARVGR